MATHSYRETLKHKGLQPFLWTQFLGAFNDNLFKIVVSMLAVQVVVPERAGRELSIVSAVFILPFLLFSGYAGQLADVYSKRTVLVVSKSLEIVAATLGFVAFLFGHLQLTYAVLFLIALQATFFSPAKYGILPEMLPDRDLSRANGVLEMSTFMAIVLGTAIGGYLFEAMRAHLWLIGVLVVGVAVVGTALSFRIPHVPAAAPGPADRPQSVGRDLDRTRHASSRPRALADGDRPLVLLVSRFAPPTRGHPVRHRGDGPQRHAGSASSPRSPRLASVSAAWRPAGCRATRSSSASRRLARLAWASSRSRLRARGTRSRGPR